MNIRGATDLRLHACRETKLLLCGTTTVRENVSAIESDSLLSVIRLSMDGCEKARASCAAWVDSSWTGFQVSSFEVLNLKCTVRFKFFYFAGIFFLYDLENLSKSYARSEGWCQLLLRWGLRILTAASLTKSPTLNASTHASTNAATQTFERLLRKNSYALERKYWLTGIFSSWK